MNGSLSATYFLEAGDEPRVSVVQDGKYAGVRPGVSSFSIHGQDPAAFRRLAAALEAAAEGIERARAGEGS